MYAVVGSMNAALVEKMKIIAVRSSALRALQSSCTGNGFIGSDGFTDLPFRPGRRLHPDGITKGMHDPTTSDLLILGHSLISHLFDLPARLQ